MSLLCRNGSLPGTGHRGDVEPLHKNLCTYFCDVSEFFAWERGGVNPNEKMTGAEIATMFGVATRTISELAARGVLERDSVKHYLLGPTIKAYTLHLRNSASGRGAMSDGYSTQRERLVREQADREAAKNAQMRGELLPAAEVERAWATILRDVKASLLALPGRVQQRIGHLSAHDIAQIDGEIRETLASLGDDDL